MMLYVDDEEHSEASSVLCEEEMLCGDGAPCVLLYSVCFVMMMERCVPFCVVK